MKHILVILAMMSVSIMANAYYYFDGRKMELVPVDAPQKTKASTAVEDVRQQYVTPSGLTVSVTNRVYFKLKENQTLNEAEQVLKTFSGYEKVEPVFVELHWYAATFDVASDSIIKYAASLFEQNLVKAAEPEFISFTPCSYGISYDPKVSEQWALYNYNSPKVDINVVDAWDFTYGVMSYYPDYTPIKIGVIDSKIDRWTADLENRILTPVSPESCVESDFAVDDKSKSFSHGTNIAAIIAANINNNIGIAGVAPMAVILPYQVDFENLTGEIVANAISTLVKKCDIINCSFSMPESDMLLDVLYTKLDNKILVAAAGDNNTNNIGYPAAYPDVICVGAINSAGKRWANSNFGDKIDYVAPGENVLTINPGGQVVSISGTSAACAYVTGVVALLKSSANLSALEIKQVLKESVNKDALYLGNWSGNGVSRRCPQYGYGLVNAYNSIIKAKAMKYGENY